jgi:thioredoxin-related protein
MKKLLLALFGICCGVSLFAAVGSTTPDGWYDDFAAAQAESAKTGRPILALFTGSDWCPYCVKLKKKALDTAEFKDFAKDGVILFFADFPDGVKLPDGLRIQNEKLAKEYGIRGFPTTVVISPKGKEMGRIVGCPEYYLRGVKTIVTTVAK